MTTPTTPTTTTREAALDALRARGAAPAFLDRIFAPPPALPTSETITETWYVADYGGALLVRCIARAAGVSWLARAWYEADGHPCWHGWRSPAWWPSESYLCG